MRFDSDSFKDILIDVLSQTEVKITFENLASNDPNVIVESTCFEALQRIRGILDNDELQDFECIDRIVTILEEIGTNAGSRHDF